MRGIRIYLFFHFIAPGFSTALMPNLSSRRGLVFSFRSYLQSSGIWAAVRTGFFITVIYAPFAEPDFFIFFMNDLFILFLQCSESYRKSFAHKNFKLVLQSGPPGFFQDDDYDGQYGAGNYKRKFHPEYEVHRKDCEAALGYDSNHHVEHIQSKTPVWFKSGIFFLDLQQNRFPKTPGPHTGIEFFQCIHIRRGGSVSPDNGSDD